MEFSRDQRRGRGSGVTGQGKRVETDPKRVHANVFIYGLERKICAETACSEAQDVDIKFPRFIYGDFPDP
jgi:hypothetical protein